MLDTSFLVLTVGPVSLVVNAERATKGISEAQLERKWKMRRASRTERSAAHRTTVGVAVDRSPEIRVECGRTSR
jgi:uncharacterized protein (DUF2342 family)